VKLENLQVIAAGRNSSFWGALKDELLALRTEALESLVETAPEKMPEICEQQQIIRVVNKIVTLVEIASEELKIFEEEEHG